jgi:hypothetical protein
MAQLLKYCILVCLLGIAHIGAFAQTQLADTIRVEAFITPEGDTIGQSWLPDVSVITKQTRAGRNYWENWTRLGTQYISLIPMLKLQGK